MRLRPVEPADLDVLFAHQQDAASRWQAAFVPEAPADDRAAFDARWRRLVGDPGLLVRTVVVEGAAGPLVAGSVGAFGPAEERQVTYWIGVEHRGRGVAGAALAALLELERTRPLFARAAADNAASLRVLGRAGFAVCARERSFAVARGREIDELVLRLG